LDEDEEVGDENLEVEEEADETQEAEQGDGDEGQGVHNDAVAKTVCAKAIVIMAKKGIALMQKRNVRHVQFFHMYVSIYFFDLSIIMIYIFIDGRACMPCS